MNDTNSQPATVEERYTTAAHTSDLTVNAERGGAGDLLIAAGWSQNRIGTALIRLHGEWDASEKPRNLDRATLEALASDIAREDGAETVDASHRRSAQDKAAQWLEHENRILLGKLKTLAYAKNQINMWAMEREIPDYPAKVSAAILWWLAPKCPACHGRCWEPIQGTPKLSNRQCRVCGGTGNRSIPNGITGRLIVGFFDDCVNVAHSVMRAKLRNLPRSR